MIKRFSIGFTVLISIFLFIFTPNVKAEEAYTLHHIDELELFDHEITEDYLYSTFDIDKTEYPYVFMWVGISEDSPKKDSTVYASLFFHKTNPYLEVSAIPSNSSNLWGFHDYNNNTVNYIRITEPGTPWFDFKIGAKKSITSNYTKNVNSNGIYTVSEQKNLYYFSNYDIVYHNTKEVVIPSSKSKSYEYKQKINSLTYSKVDFKFNIPINMEKELDLSYDFHLVNENNELDGSHTFKNPYFSEKFTSCSTDESGASSCSPNDKLNQFVITESEKSCDLNSFDSGGCYGVFDYSKLENSKINILNKYKIDNYKFKFNSDIENKITTSFVLTLDLTFNSDVIVDTFLNSSISFEVVYYERSSGGSSSENYYSTVDMTGKYGALFAPKLDISKQGLTVRTLFKGVGHLDVQHRSSYSNVGYDILSAYSLNYCNNYLSNQDKIPYYCNDISGEFEFYLSNSNLEQALFFVNSEFENDLTAEVYVTYDTRYYEYYLFGTPTDIVSVVNPNTNETYYISLDEFYNYADVDPGFIESLVIKFRDWFYEHFPVVYQFKQLISLFTYNEYYNEAPTFEVDMSDVGINQKLKIIDFSVFDEYRSTVIFWEMLVVTTYTVVKVTDNIVKAFKGG